MTDISNNPVRSPTTGTNEQQGSPVVTGGVPTLAMLDKTISQDPRVADVTASTPLPKISLPEETKKESNPPNAGPFAQINSFLARYQTPEAPEARNFKNTLEKYKNARQAILSGQVQSAPPELADTILWLQKLESRPLGEIYNDPKLKEHIIRVWRTKTFDYVTKGYELNPNSPGHYREIIDRLRKIYHVALGNDDVLDADDLEVIYNNFAAALDLDPSSNYTRISFAEWWKDPNTSPFAKLALLLGLPLAFVGITNHVFKGRTVGDVLLLLGSDTKTS